MWHKYYANPAASKFYQRETKDLLYFWETTKTVAHRFLGPVRKNLSEEYSKLGHHIYVEMWHKRNP